MQYLAEVQKKSGVFGGGKAELKLLACQRGDSWTAVPGEEVIPIDDGGNFNGGALVFAEVSPNKQVQGSLKDASRQIVSILQSYSRLQEKTKTQEEEIKQWQESLTYQSQELNRRQMEMEAQIEQLEQINQEAEELEAKRSEIEAGDREVVQLREEMERKQQELDAAWAQLNSQQADGQQGGTIDPEQANSLQEWLNYLAGVAIDPNSVQDPLNGAAERVAAGQSFLDEQWQQLEQQREAAEQQQGQIDPRAGEIANGWQQWHDSIGSLERDRIDLRVRENTLELKQVMAGLLDTQIQQLGTLSGSPGGNSGASSGDSGNAENLSAHELQRLVRSLRKDFAEPFSFFSDQEEELALSRQEIAEVEAKMKDSFGAQRESLENELKDLEESYRFLFETVSGQLQNILERQRSMNQNQTLLWKRLGQTEPESGRSSSSVDMAPLIGELSQKRQQVETEMETLRQGLDEMRGSLEQRAGDLENQRNELKNQEHQLDEDRSSVARLWGKIALYEEILQPVQDRLNELREKIEAATAGVAQIQEMGASQQQAIAQLQESISGLVQSAAVA